MASYMGVDDPSVIACGKPNGNAAKLCFEECNIQVYLRIRPQEKRELIDYSIDDSILQVTNSKTGQIKSFQFTDILSENASQSEVYKACVTSLLNDFVLGNNVSIMAYGTSGAGKTHSILGSVKSPGLVPRILHNIFEIFPNTNQQVILKPNDNLEAEILDNATRDAEFKSLTSILRSCQQNKRKSILAYSGMKDVMSGEFKINNSIETDTVRYIWISFAEIYNEAIYDLLDTKPLKNGASRPKLKIHDNKYSAYIKGLTKIPVRTGEEAYKILKYGQRNLQYAATKINSSSSRSHCIFTLYLIRVDGEDATVSKFNFCDLAGSERVSNTNHTGMRLKESQAINSALHVLGRCIKIVQENQKNNSNQIVPFRESKLTMLFHKALLGQERLALLVNVHPKQIYFEETMNSLNFAALAKEILLDKEQCTRISKINVTKYFNAVPSSTMCEDETILVDSEDESEDGFTTDELLEFINQKDAQIQDLEMELESEKLDKLDLEERLRKELTTKFLDIFNARVSFYENALEEMKKKYTKELEDKDKIINSYRSINANQSVEYSEDSEPNTTANSEIINISDDMNQNDNSFKIEEGNN